jgi:dihydrodipicolinate synthase/N-acetylneuraminate lyase
MAPGTFLGSSAAPGATPELIGQMIALDNVFGYIISDNIRFESRVRLFAPREKRFWASNGTLLLPGAVLGANGACLMLGNVFPQECHDILRLVMQGKLAEAQRLQSRVIEADWQILSRGAAGLKAALNLLGFETGNPRSPSLACDATTVAQIRTALLHAGATGNLFERLPENEGRATK